MPKFLPLCALLVCASASAAIPSSQRQALIAFYDATGGDAWTDRSEWKGAEGTECNWFGIECDNDGGTVIGIQIYGNNLRGTIPPQVAQLTDLETLYVQNNQLTGVIPKEVGALKKLERLGADGNQLPGPLPKELGDLVALEELGLSYNAITGPIPPELGHLTNLVALELSVNQLSGKIPPESWLTLSSS